MGKVTRKLGFTLFELLVAMSVIAIIATVTFSRIDLRLYRDTPTMGVRVLSDLMRVARTQAILNGAPARLIINYDETDIDRFLRYAGVVVAERSDNGLPTDKWIAVDRGVYLPVGVYVVPRADSGNVTFADTWALADGRKSQYDISKTNHSPAVYQFDYPLQEPVKEGSGSQRWIVLQFGPDGRLQSSTGGKNGQDANYFVIGPGRYQGGQLLFSDGSMVKGIGLKKTGAFFSIEDIDYYEGLPEGGEDAGGDDGEA